jgi:EAL domain-containing protein (putative c-di-GMP-specific phosphodiesterase class I)
VERDEFAILLVNASPSAVRGAADRLAHAIAQDPAIEVTPSISTGWAAGGGAFAEGGGAKEAWAEARQALWVARELGGGEVLGAGTQRTPQADARDRLLARVVRAHTLTVVHEGVVDLASGRLIAIEAVARPAWMPTNQGIAELFTAAREMGALAMLEHTARAALIEASSALPDRLPLHINVSRSGVPGAAAADAAELAAQLRGIGREPHTVVLDLTDAAECPLPVVAEAAAAYREQGFQLSIEGIRGAALAAQLVEIVAPAVLKLDHSTLRRTVISASARDEIVQLVSRAHALGTLVVGTAIDTPGMAEQAVALGITAGQGRHFEREQLPLSA